MVGEERIINRNKWLYGPGPVARVSNGYLSYFARLPPAQGFASAAGVGMVLALMASYSFKFVVADPSIKAIEDFYKENPVP